jgi:hypothetical protein
LGARFGRLFLCKNPKRRYASASMSWTRPVIDWSSFADWHEFTRGNLFNQRAFLYYRMRDGGARFDSVVELEGELRHADWVFAEPIAQYLAEVAADPGEWPDPKKYPAGALNLILHRLDVVANWMSSHEVEGRNPLVFPTSSIADLLQWLCGPFWEEHGRRLAAETLMLDEADRCASQRELLALATRGKKSGKRRLRPAQINVERRGPRPECEPDSWSTLAEWLQAEVPVFHAFPRVYDILRDQGHAFEEMEAVNATVRSADEHYAKQLRLVVLRFAERGKWPSAPMHPDLGTLLAARIEGAARWARTHVMQSDCLITYPAIPFRRFLRWLLLNWWDRPGRYVAADQIMLMMVAETKR